MVRKIKKLNKNLKEDKNKFLLDCEEALKKIKISTILEKIENFRKLNLKSIDDKTLSKEILNVLTNNEGKALLIPQIMQYTEKTRFYRIRKIDNSNLNIPLKEFISIQDAWNPPAEYIKSYGRLNKPGESLLYVTPEDIRIPIEELKVGENEVFGLIVYESIDKIKVNSIGMSKDYSKMGFSEDEINKLKIIDNFLNTEFTRDVGKGTEFLYRVSEMIAKDYFDLPPRDIQDAWVYSSIASKLGYNCCFRPEIAKEKLKLLGVQLMKYKKDEKGLYFEVKCVCIPEENKLKYYKCSDEKVKEIFPEINC